MSLCFNCKCVPDFVFITLGLFAIQVCCLIPIIFWVCAHLFIYANLEHICFVFPFLPSWSTKQLKILLSMSSVCLIAQSLRSFINYHNPYELLCCIIYLHRVWALIQSVIAFRDIFVLFIVFKQYQLFPIFLQFSKMIWNTRFLWVWAQFVYCCRVTTLLNYWLLLSFSSDNASQKK